MNDLYERIRRKFHLRTRQEAKSYAFGILYSDSDSRQQELLELVSEHEHEKLHRDHGGEGG